MVVKLKKKKTQTNFGTIKSTATFEASDSKSACLYIHVDPHVFFANTFYLVGFNIIYS